MENSIKYFFSETRPFFEQIFYKVYFHHWKSQKKIQKMIKQLLDKQIFASSDARFCRNLCNGGCYTQNFVSDMRNFSLDMVLSP